MEKLKPLKRFGQNYLVDKNTIQRIVNQFSPNEDDNVVEIGPGQGALTSLLSKTVKHYRAIEIDKRVIDDLRLSYPKVDFINQDFLEIELKELAGDKKLRVIGNIPYNITSPIIFKLIEERESISDAMMMVQYEVAKRIVGKPRTKDYGILSVLTNYFAETELCFKIPPTVFYPKPNVDSAIVSFKFGKATPTDIDEKLFVKVVKAAFGNRRKTLKNSLSNNAFGDLNFDSLPFDFTRRAEELTIDQFVELTRLIQNSIK
ncbi:MAG: ribosomal RNA small subunit methyltransferase A [Stygiobacter sp. RIFOXYC12_FULL_38_8]|nr:MAG: ribosomal RNA small subunit methyltransferase A [Stygiobacter sp. GWC2_38_9]OGV08327.1 MAG: ribosomal RNA small subunit methyltransferase A [Stygiobacter sp. RIFOXYB2_FULL_37_11]OGV12154.1 MAG: ribosomal RNA small subunit methyltransferase A [Stygiobacter sp. RIFOXYC2_FULL_38_25]OGV12201.1 MAG: ribosomal RNA small subunit methyltransferase A [Stygiobacter sp. RIFOXYA2_FULL_38_8]OGV24191.1 MAG: ribosomal RNA small subunit methyltransferase A [Stygiobacter sp. RIFOXYC12_FULL_38_8]OGV8128